MSPGWSCRLERPCQRWPLDLLTQVLLQLKRQTTLAAAEPFGDALEVMRAHRRLGQLAQQIHQGRDRLLELIGLGQVTFRQRLLDLPVQPERRLIEQGSVITGAMVLEELIRILAGGEMHHPKFKLPLQGQLFHLPDRSVGGANPSTVGIEVENDALAIS